MNFLRHLLPVVFMHLSAFVAFAQVKHGTIVVIYHASDKIILAADSREAGSDSSDDKACKIATPDGKIIFAGTGLGKVDSTNPLAPSWSSPDDIRQAFDIVRLSSYGRLDKIVETFEDIELHHFNSSYRQNPEPFLKVARENHVLADDIIGGLNSYGQLEAYEMPVFLAVGDNVAAWPKPLTCPTDPYCATGKPEVANEFLGLTSERAKKEKRTWKPPRGSDPADYPVWKAARLVELTERYGPRKEVGGPIDIVELDKNGTVCWLANKKNCPVD